MIFLKSKKKKKTILLLCVNESICKSHVKMETYSISGVVGELQVVE